MLALARRLGNQALERVLGQEFHYHAPNASPRGGVDQPTVARLAGVMGGNLSDVRVVDDAGSHAAAQALGATALAAGDTVLIGRDAPPPSSPAREQLLAHELAHVAQQREAGAVRDGVSTAGDAHERAADAAAAHAIRGESATAVAAGAPTPNAASRPLNSSMQTHGICCSSAS